MVPPKDGEFAVEIGGGGCPPYDAMRLWEGGSRTSPMLVSEVCEMDGCGRERRVCFPAGNIDGERIDVDGGAAMNSRGAVCPRSAPPE